MISDIPTEEARSRFEPQAEYAQVCILIRHFSILRLAQLAIFFALMLGLLALLFQQKGFLAQFGVNASLSFASFLTLIFWLLDERAARQYQHLLGRAEGLERILHFKTFLERPKHRFLRPGMAIRLIYAATLVWWISAVASISRSG